MKTREKEKKPKRNEIEDIYNFILNISNKKILKIVAISITLLFFIIALKNIIFYNHSSNILILASMYSLISIFTLWILFITKNKFLPFIKQKKEECNKGNIWFIGNFKKLKSLKIIIFFHEFFNIMMLLVLIFNFMYLLIFAMTLIFSVVFSFIYAESIIILAAGFIGTTILMILFVSIISLTKKSFITEKKILQIVIYEYGKLNKKEKYVQFDFLLKLLKNYSFNQSDKLKRNFVKKILTLTIEFYLKFGKIILDEKDIEEYLFPKIKKIILEEDYLEMLNFIEYIGERCKNKNQIYEKHKDLIESLLRNKYTNLYELSNNLGKLKIKGELKFIKIIKKLFSRINVLYQSIFIIGIIFFLFITIMKFSGMGVPDWAFFIGDNFKWP